MGGWVLFLWGGQHLTFDLSSGGQIYSLHEASRAAYAEKGFIMTV